MPDHREDQIVEWLRKSLARRGNFFVGDDAAILPVRGRWVVTVDQQILDTHFTAALPAPEVAKRLLAVNLSDLAAMGARARFAFLALSCPADYEIKRFLGGMLRSCDRYEVSLAGGDIARSPVLSAALTLVGELPARKRPLLRSKARAGDALWLGGSVGESAIGRLFVKHGAVLRGRSITLPSGLSMNQKMTAPARQAVRRHLQPQPQIELGQWLVQQPRSAAIDISDGLALDLARICRASKVGAVIDAEQIPVPKQLKSLAAVFGQKPLDLALGGGEDYVLLFALPRHSAPPGRLHCTQIGQVTESTSIDLKDRTGQHPLLGQGWDHLVES